MKRSSWFIQVGSKLNFNCSKLFKTQWQKGQKKIWETEEEKTKTHTEEGYANTEAEIVLMWPYAKNSKECWQPPEVGRGQLDSPLESPARRGWGRGIGGRGVGGMQLCQHLEFGLWPSELWDNKFLLVQATHFVVICYYPRKWIQPQKH